MDKYNFGILDLEEIGLCSLIYASGPAPGYVEITND